MSHQHDDETPLSGDDEAFVRNVADLYAPPPMTALQRSRFDARLEERISDRAARRRPWFAVAAGVAAALSLLLWRATNPAPGGDEVEQIAVAMPTQSEADASADEWILAMTTESRADADDTLPPEYLAISDLLLGN